jgi:hypothetical protein
VGGTKIGRGGVGSGRVVGFAYEDVVIIDGMEAAEEEDDDMPIRDGTVSNERIDPTNLFFLPWFN